MKHKKNSDKRVHEAAYFKLQNPVQQVETISRDGAAIKVDRIVLSEGAQKALNGKHLVKED